MLFTDFVYITFITIALCVAYFILRALFPFLFAQKITRPRKNPLFPLVSIIIFAALISIISFLIPDLELGNRILHAFGGGFLGFFVCFLAARDSGIHISKFQFFVFSALIVVSLGVANELLEFFLQEYGELFITANVNDTWLDLTSNAVGIVLASACLVPFHKDKTQGSDLTRT